MDGIQKVETLTTQDVAKMLRTSPMKIKAAIKNGTMPIGMVAKENGSTQERTIIIRERWQKWIAGTL